MRLATITNWAYGITLALTATSAATMLLSSKALERERAAVAQRFTLDQASDHVAEDVTSLSDLAAGYVMSGEPARLTEYQGAVTALKDVEARIAHIRDIGAQPDELNAIADAIQRADGLLDEQAEAVAAREHGDEDHARRVLFGTDYARELERIDADVERFQYRLDGRANAELTAAINTSRAWKICSEFVLSLTGALFLGVLYFIFKRRVLRPVVRLSDVVNRLAAQDYAQEPPHYQDIDEIGDLSQALRQFRINGLERQRLEHERNAEFAMRSLLSRMTQRMQECETRRQLQQVVEGFVPSIAPHYSGRLYLYDDARNAVAEVCTWQGEVRSDTEFAPSSCWALQRGEMHRPRGGSVDVLCEHVNQALYAADTICLPLIAQHTVLGMLYLEKHATAADEPEIADADLKSLAESLSLSLGNLNLRVRLQQLSLSDPLTGLANRRHLDSVLSQRFIEARQTLQGVSCIMMDLDHFKRINDSWGHEAGDAVLRRVAELLMQATRESDLAARYGGEEFLLLMPQLSTAAALQRAEDLRLRLRALRIEIDGRQLGPITASFGVATAPEQCGYDTLVQTADAALYRAKAAGRDRVVAAEVRSRPSLDAGARSVGAYDQSA